MKDSNNAVTTTAPQLELGLPELFKPTSLASKVFEIEQTKEDDGRASQKIVIRKRDEIAKALNLDPSKDKDEIDAQVLASRDEIKAMIDDLSHKLRSDPHWTGGNLRFVQSKANKAGVVTRRIYTSFQTVIRGAGPSDESIAKAWSERTGIKVTAADIAAMREKQLKALAPAANQPPIDTDSNKSMTDEELERATRPGVEVGS